MAVYTDGIHLVATTLDELHAFAQAIGMKPKWFQKRRPQHPHYDILSHRRLAAAYVRGAINVRSRQIVEMFESGELEQLPTRIMLSPGARQRKFERLLGTQYFNNRE